MKVRANLMNADDMNRALKRISHQILERNQGADHIVLLGIKSRGIPLAELLADHLHTIEGVQVPVGQLDITRFRDDRSRAAGKDTSRIPVDITGKHVILVDDVLYTGRTVRAALDAVSAYGRAASIQLAVLIDRGHRELPIRADYVGKMFPPPSPNLLPYIWSLPTAEPAWSCWEKSVNRLNFDSVCSIFGSKYVRPAF